MNGQMISPQKTSGMAVTGLVMGILSLFCCGPLFGLLGIIFSAIGISQVNKNPTQFTGKGMAVAGLVMSIIGVILGTILLLIYGAAIMAGIVSQSGFK
jgi:hypothetical protein